MNSRLFVTFDKEINERVFCLMGLNDHHNYSFEFYGDSIIQKNQTANVTAKLLDDGVPLINQNISFVVDGTTTSATTDEFGEATISYKGTGKGIVPIQANYGMLLQETYSVLEVLFYDKAVTGHKNENTSYNTNCEETVEDTGTIVAYKGSGAYLQYKFGQTTSSAKPFSIGTAIEFDIVDTNGMSVLFVGNSNYARQAPQVACNMKITITSEHITWYQDNTQIAQVQTSNYISDNFSVGFTTNGSGKYIKYKEMKIYPI